MKWIRAFFVGLLPTMVLGGLMFGFGTVSDPVNLVIAGGFLFVCPFTAIIAWPASVLVGFVIVAVFRHFSGRGTIDPAKTASNARRNATEGIVAARTSTSKKGALDDFVREAIRRGTGESEVIRLLTGNGWPEADVREALGRLGSAA